MPYLGFPDIPLVGFWDDTQSFKIEPLELSITEGALTSRGPRNRINRTKHNWSISGNILNGIEVDEFLKERNSQPFAFSIANVEADKKLYYCVDYSISLLSYVVASDRQLWAFKGTFVQLYRAAIA